MKDREWWDSLTDEQKFQNYQNLKEVNRSHADTLHTIVSRLLGNDYYTIACDVYGSNQEILHSINYHYRDVNYNWNRTLNKIKNSIKDYFKNL